MDEAAEEDALQVDTKEEEENYFIPKKELIIGFSQSRRMDDLLAELN